MKDGSKKITVLVSNPALENFELAPADREAYFGTFKLYRKSFERIACEKYAKGEVRQGACRGRRNRVHPGDRRADVGAN